MPRLPFLLPAALLAGCLGGFTDRYARGNAALSTREGAAYLVVLSPVLQQVLNQCVPAGLRGAAPVIVVVADVNAGGHALGIDVEPDSPGTECFERELAAHPLARPPLKAGEATFPLGLKIESR